jgi:hypothetical protein
MLGLPYITDALTKVAGVGATDIAKLKAAGYWTVTVSTNCTTVPIHCLLLRAVCPWCYQKDSRQDQGVQRDQGRESERSHREVPSK